MELLKELLNIKETISKVADFKKNNNYHETAAVKEVDHIIDSFRKEYVSNNRYCIFNDSKDVTKENKQQNKEFKFY